MTRTQLQICSESSSVDAFIEAPQQTSDWYSEDFADPEQGGHGDRSPSFDLLPVSGGEAEGDHIFLAETFGFPQFADLFA